MVYRQNAALEFAARIAAMGFRVYLAERGHHGFITDDAETRVLSFSFSDGGSLGGNYSPPSRESGTGWRMEASPWNLRSAEDVRRALYATAPEFAGRGWRTYTTVAQYLARYGVSSRFSRVGEN